MTKCNRVSRQGSKMGTQGAKAVNQFATSSEFGHIFGLSSIGAKRGGNRILALLDLHVYEHEWCENLPHVPGDIEGEHSKKHMGPDPILTVVIDPTQIKVDYL